MEMSIGGADSRRHKETLLDRRHLANTIASHVAAAIRAVAVITVANCCVYLCSLQCFDRFDG